MYLSKLDIVGFKSFAQKTALRFNDGITAVVGPNGCGKSNIIDAIRWVIGEQKASALRSDKMEEVIFNGAGKRRPLGMAEVSLTIENTKGILPTEYSEVTITRRLFRNGDSEYLLNKVQCRLKDIVDLFMDTGMGANAYSVIELKMIETILSDRAEERRRLFDEAAGVTKYKVRRREALRRLDATQQDLNRVNDIIREVGRKANSLERQAKRAEEFSVLDTERKELEIEIIGREYAQTIGRIAPLEEKLAAARIRKDELDAQLAREEGSIQQLEEQQAAIEAQHLQAQGVVNSVNQRISKLERERAVAEERRRSLLMTIERAEREKVEAEQAIARLTADRENLEQQLVALREQIVSAEAEYEGVRQELTGAENALNDRRRAAKNSQGEVIAVLNRISELRGSEERTHSRLDSIRQRLTEIELQDEEARQDRAKSQESFKSLEAEIYSAQELLTAAQREFERAQEAKNALRAEIDEIRNRSIELHNAINSRESKLDFLSGLVDQDESVQFLVGQQDWSSGERITVAEALYTDEKYRQVIAAALGDAAHFLVVPTFDDAVRGMHSLESNKKGKATFVCLDRIPEPSAGVSFEGREGITRASDVCSSAPEHDRLRRYLLSATAIVDSVHSANELLMAGVAEQAVTPEGVLIRSGGVVRGGGKRKDEGITIGKREQIERLENELLDLRFQLGGLKDSIAQKSQQHDEVNLGALSDNIRRAQQELGQVEKRRAQTEYEIEYAEDVLEEHQAERRQMSDELLRLEERLSGTEPQRTALQSEQERAERSAQELAAELDAMEHAFASLVQAANQRHVALVEVRNGERTAQSDLDRARREIENAERLIAQRGREKQSAIEEMETLDSGIANESGQLEQLRVDQTEAIALLDTVIQQQSAKRDEIAKQADTLRTDRRGYEGIVAEIHDLEMKVQDLRTRAEGMVARAAEELEFDVLAAEIAETDRTIEEMRSRLRELKDRIKQLGTVNLLAYEEWMTESERHKFLQGQASDLKNAEKALLDTILEINETAQKKFVETFEQIRQNFTGIFTSLFLEGDEADLKLEDGDPLEAKIEIIAKPRGKRPHSIDLLSGGEKTLTAIALLFSIYLVKPSPFCILDEVDAPLDDANIDRFIQLIRRFATDTQFILVTHNKRTMNAADTMYGVTQEEDGVSKIVSVRFTGDEKSKVVQQPVKEPETVLETMTVAAHVEGV